MYKPPGVVIGLVCLGLKLRIANEGIYLIEHCTYVKVMEFWRRPQEKEKEKCENFHYRCTQERESTCVENKDP